MPQEIMGMVWYKREDYDRIRSICDDGDHFHATYDEWLEEAEACRKHLEGEGIKIVTADLDPDRFLALCNTKKMRPNASARNWLAHDAAHRAIRHS